MALIDHAAKTLDERVDSLRCIGLCQECCGPIPFPKRLRKMFPKIPLPSNPVQVLFRVLKDGPYVCPFLQDGKCSIYLIRPAICHLWGASEEMPCPHGCKPDGPLLNKFEGYRYLREHKEGTI